MAFPDILGHARVRDVLATALGRGRLPQALLLSGPEGVGKRTLARSVIRALLCPTRSGSEGACETCAVCSRVQRELHPDVMMVVPDGTSIKIERIREASAFTSSLPFEAPARALLIDDAHLMTEQAQNSLLKSLEEPPATSHLFLVTGSPQALLPTIRSRCQHLRLGALPGSELAHHLQERLGLGADEARLRAALSGGSLGVALAFASDGYRALRGELIELLEKAAAASALERMEASDRLFEREDLPHALTILRSVLRDVVALRAGATPESLLNADEAQRLHGLSQTPLGVRGGEVAEQAGEMLLALRQNVNRQLSLDVLIDAMHEIR